VSSGREQNVRVVGRYALYNAIAAGGMATVHLGRLLGPVGFSRTVAIKRLHAQFATDPEFVSMFLDEARLAARIRHPNVVPTLDVVATQGELFLVMEYVPGESVARLSRALRDRQQTIPLRILSTIIAGLLHGLHAAHEAKDERGHPLGIVHRDVSPQNVLVGTDGVPRVLDFGVAKAAGRMQTTKEGQIKGKLSYMPPEQLRGAAVSRQTDIYAAGVMLWELVTGQRLFSGDNEGAIVAKVLDGRVDAPSRVLFASRKQTLTDHAMRQLEALDATILRSLKMKPEERFTTAREMAVEIERKCPPATASEVADWLESVAAQVLESRAQMVAEIESSTSLAGTGDHVQAVLNAKATLTNSSFPHPDQRLGDSSRASTHDMHAPHGHASTMQSAYGPVPTPPTRAHSPMAKLGQGTVAMNHGLGFQPEGPPVTQPSSISVSTGTYGTSAGDNNASKRTAAAAIIGVLLGVCVLASALVINYTRNRTAASAAAPSAEPVPIATAGATSNPVTSATVPGPVVVVVTGDAGITTTDATATSTASIGTAVTPTPVVKPTATVRPQVKHDPKPAEPKAASTNDPNDCTTPYWYDAQGVKRYKPQCLGGK
jgi:eukaryotic-like serine/threonine-protein kinase